MLMLRPRCGPPRRRSHRPGAEAATPSAAWPGCYAEARLPGTFYFSPPTKGLRRRRRAAAGGRPASAFPAAVAWFGEAFVPAWPPAGDRRPLRGRIGRRRTRAQPPAERLLRPGRGRSAQSPRL